MFNFFFAWLSTDFGFLHLSFNYEYFRLIETYIFIFDVRATDSKVAQKVGFHLIDIKVGEEKCRKYLLLL